MLNFKLLPVRPIRIPRQYQSRFIHQLYYQIFTNANRINKSFYYPYLKDLNLLENILSKSLNADLSFKYT